MTKGDDGEMGWQVSDVAVGEVVARHRSDRGGLIKVGLIY